MATRQKQGHLTYPQLHANASTVPAKIKNRAGGRFTLRSRRGRVLQSIQKIGARGAAYRVLLGRDEVNDNQVVTKS